MEEADVVHELAHRRRTLQILPQATNLRRKRDATSQGDQEVVEGTSTLMGLPYPLVAQVLVDTIMLGREVVSGERMRQTEFSQSHIRGLEEKAEGKVKERRS